jgi:hypothetical protein
MTDLYPSSYSSPVAAPAQLAGNILKAWACRDETTLRQEFAKGLDLCSSPHGLSLDEENLDLLKAVVGKLDDRPAPLHAEPADPVVRLCINLLLHLASQPYGSAQE